MHIMEGYLPATHALAWTAVSAPFFGFGVWRLSKSLKDSPDSKMFLGACGGFCFALSALKLPSLAGSSSHPTGVGLGGILAGPSVMSVLGLIVLVFQALFLAHGGLTTLGANVFSMAIVGGHVAWGVHVIARRIGVPSGVAIFFAATMSDLATYCTTSFQLALAFPDPAGGFFGAFAKFLGIFAFTQLPLAVAEGLLTVYVVKRLVQAVPRSVLDQFPSLRRIGA